MVVATADNEFNEAALNELRRADPKLKFEHRLSPEIFLISTSFDFDSFAALVAGVEPIFLRHIAPATLHIPLTNTETDLTTLADAVASAFSLPADSQFAVQVRFIEKPEARPYTPFAIKEAVANRFVTESGAQENIKEPEWIVSICCTPDTAYLGLSEAAQNLSSWPGGERRFARESGQISRAEFKLLEAFEVFDLELPEEGLVLDLGAAPGGWTRVFLHHGLAVVAVDPAELDARVLMNRDVEHYKGYAEDFFNIARQNKYKFDIIASDIRIDAGKAAEIMIKASSFMKRGGFAITTLKLPHAAPKFDPVKIMQNALSVLRAHFNEVHARQLFHNRQEVTVVLRKE